MSGTGAVGANYGDLLVTSLVVLGAVCVAAYAVVRVFGRLLATGRTKGAHLMGVVARLSLEPRRALYVVEVAGKTLLVGTSEMGLSVLSELDAVQVRAQVASRPSFGELVRAAWLRRRDVSARGSGEGAAEEAVSPGERRSAQASHDAADAALPMQHRGERAPADNRDRAEASEPARSSSVSAALRDTRASGQEQELLVPTSGSELAERADEGR